MWPRLNPVVYLITTPISFLYPKCQQSSWYKKNILILSHSYLWKYSVTGSPVVDTRSGANSVRARQNKATSLIGHVISKSHDTLTLFMNDGNFTHIWDMDRGRRTKTWACTTWNCFFYAQGYIETYKKNVSRAQTISASYSAVVILRDSGMFMAVYMAVYSNSTPTRIRTSQLKKAA